MIFAEVTVSTAFLVVALIAIAGQAIIIYTALFDRGLKYRISHAPTEAIDSEQFLYQLEALTDSKLHRRVELHVFTNGDQFYEAELESIRAAKNHVHIEAYIFQPGEVTRRFIDALCERARAGVNVKLTLDGVGSAGTSDSYLQPLKDAGAEFAWYHPLRIPKLPRYNNRTHRELLIVDADTAFVGGAGWADHWFRHKPKEPRWRDTMVRVHGDAVSSLQSVFAENWLEACGELLTGPDCFPLSERTGDSAVLVIGSTPSAGGSTHARILFQSLLASAKERIHFCTPYFLPDKSIQEEIIRAICERGVSVKIVVPGPHNDHALTRSSSRLAYGRLLKAGARIFEYSPAMIHAKVLMVDGLWSVVGSTNFDNRSFGLNDEVNLAARDAAFTARLEQDFARDLANSFEMTYERWQRRPVLERFPEMLGWIVERQQ